MPSELHELTDLSLYNKKPEPQLQKTVVSEWRTPESNLIDESYKKDLAWILGAWTKTWTPVNTRVDWFQPAFVDCKTTSHSGGSTSHCECSSTWIRDSLDGDLKVKGNDAPQKWQVHCYYHGRGPIQQGKDVAMGKDRSAQGCHHCAWRFSYADDFFKTMNATLSWICRKHWPLSLWLGTTMIH